jgi:hypothetical protein
MRRYVPVIEQRLGKDGKYRPYARLKAIEPEPLIGDHSRLRFLALGFAIAIAISVVLACIPVNG